MMMWLSIGSHLHCIMFFLSQHIFLIGQLSLKLLELNGFTQFSIGWLLGVYLLPRYNDRLSQRTMNIFFSRLLSRSCQLPSQLSTLKVKLPYTSSPNIPIVIIHYLEDWLLNKLLTEYLYSCRNEIQLQGY